MSGKFIRVESGNSASYLINTDLVDYIYETTTKMGNKESQIRFNSGASLHFSGHVTELMEDIDIGGQC